jgi:hypothetical protein
MRPLIGGREAAKAGRVCPGMSVAVRQDRVLGLALSPRALLLMACGALWGIVFFVVYMLEGATRPGYDARTQAISALSLGPGGWIQQVNFVLFGVVQIAAALGWYWSLRPGPVAVGYPLLKAIAGVGLIVDGLFSQDPSLGYPPGSSVVHPTLHGQIHALFAYVTITAVALSCFVLAVRFGRSRGGGGWAAYAVLTGLGTIVLIAIYGSLIDRGPAGVFERLATAIESLFVVLVVGRLLVRSAPLP